MNNNLHTYLFIGLSLVLTVSFFVLKISNGNQEEVLAQNHQAFQAIQLMIQKNENLEQAQEVVSNMDQDNYLVRKTAGLIHAKQKNYEAAIVEYQVALDLAPKLATDSVFMLQFAEFHLFEDKEPQALEIATMAQKYDKQRIPEVTENITKILNGTYETKKGEG